MSPPLGSSFESKLPRGGHLETRGWVPSPGPRAPSVNNAIQATSVSASEHKPREAGRIGSHTAAIPNKKEKGNEASKYMVSNELAGDSGVVS